MRNQGKYRGRRETVSLSFGVEKVGVGGCCDVRHSESGRFDAACVRVCMGVTSAVLTPGRCCLKIILTAVTSLLIIAAMRMMRFLVVDRKI